MHTDVACRSLRKCHGLLLRTVLRIGYGLPFLAVEAHLQLVFRCAGSLPKHIHLVYIVCGEQVYSQFLVVLRFGGKTVPCTSPACSCVAVGCQFGSCAVVFLRSGCYRLVQGEVYLGKLLGDDSQGVRSYCLDGYPFSVFLALSVCLLHFFVDVVLCLVGV